LPARKAIGQRLPSGNTVSELPIPVDRPTGFALATTLHFMLSGHVAFPDQNSSVVACATEILAQPGKQWACAEPCNPSNGDHSP
jgi:hypothetical protein